MDIILGFVGLIIAVAVGVAIALLGAVFWAGLFTVLAAIANVGWTFQQCFSVALLVIAFRFALNVLFGE